MEYKMGGCPQPAPGMMEEALGIFRSLGVETVKGG